MSKGLKTLNYYKILPKIQGSNQTTKAARNSLGK
jgi:hypothetical protein